MKNFNNNDMMRRESMSVAREYGWIFKG
jgi:hypothetical protein